MKFAVIDVETTGLYPARDKITEIGIVVIEDGAISYTHAQLVNPGVKIPDKITSLTGICNEMVADAPFFENIVEQIEEILSDAIIVGHHVNFDYSFLKNEMNSAGFHFSKKTICTAELCRYLYSQLSSFSLAALCKHFGIINSHPHRALPDAMATAEIFLKLYEQLNPLFVKNLFRKVKGSSLIPGHLRNTIYRELPSGPGVYYFMGHNGKPFYIGKAAKIKSRVLSHFRSEGNSLNILSLGSRISRIKYSETGTETLAMLLEDHEIRHYWPQLNSAQKKNTVTFGVACYRDQHGNWRMNIAKNGKAHCYIATFHQYHLAVAFVKEKTEEYRLNAGFCSLPANDSEFIEDHNSNFELMLRKLSQTTVEIYTGVGRFDEEKSFLWIENGRYKGFGFVPKSSPLEPELLLPHLKLCRTSVTSEAIIRKMREQETPAAIFQLPQPVNVLPSGLFDLAQLEPDGQV